LTKRFQTENSKVFGRIEIYLPFKDYHFTIDTENTRFPTVRNCVIGIWNGSFMNCEFRKALNRMTRGIFLSKTSLLPVWVPEVLAEV
jgi:hypothetical protein